jgi:hypothetical protein
MSAGRDDTVDLLEARGHCLKEEGAVVVVDKGLWEAARRRANDAMQAEEATEEGTPTPTEVDGEPRSPTKRERPDPGHGHRQERGGAGDVEVEMWEGHSQVADSKEERPQATARWRCGEITDRSPSAKRRDRGPRGVEEEVGRRREGGDRSSRRGEGGTADHRNVEEKRRQPQPGGETPSGRLSEKGITGDNGEVWHREGTKNGGGPKFRVRGRNRGAPGRGANRGSRGGAMKEEHPISGHDGRCRARAATAPATRDLGFREPRGEGRSGAEGGTSGKVPRRGRAEQDWEGTPTTWRSDLAVVVVWGGEGRGGGRRGGEGRGKETRGSRLCGLSLAAADAEGGGDRLRGGASWRRRSRSPRVTLMREKIMFADKLGKHGEYAIAAACMLISRI